MKTKVCTQHGFDIYFEALEEYSPSFEYWDEDLAKETIKSLQNGSLILFCAHVTAEKNGVELADDYLGMCVYKSEEDFYNMKDDYFDDMKTTVIKEAKECIQQLRNDYVQNDSLMPVNAGGII